MPTVTVLMPVYNGEKYLKDAINSILNQTYSGFEFLIIDDGSSDNSHEIINSFRDSRIRLVSNRTNKGLPYSLNSGILLSRGKYIARMDCDDIADWTRLEHQVKYLDDNLKIGILGSYYELLINDNTKRQIIATPVSDLEIRFRCLFECPFGHPTVMFRREIFLKHNLLYSSHLNAVEDYELWGNILDYTEGANISTPLLSYRLHKDSISFVYKREQLKNHVFVSFQYIKRQLPDLDFCKQDVAAIIEMLNNRKKRPTRSSLEYYSSLLSYIHISSAFIAKYPENQNASFVRKARGRVALMISVKAIRNLPLKLSFKIILIALKLSPGLSFDLIKLLLDYARILNCQ